MGRKVLLNYDELRTIVKRFRDEGEDIVQMQLSLRHKVQDLHREWVGEGADKFFTEMENELLPALSRLAGALFLAQDVLHRIIQLIQSFDEMTVGYFKADLTSLHPINLGAVLGGAGLAAGLGAMGIGSITGGAAGAGPGGTSDGSGQASSPDQPLGASGQPATAGSGADGGGGLGVGSSQGLQGSLGSPGTSASGGQNYSPGSGGTAGTGTAGIQDHVYGSQPASGSVSGGSGTGSAGGSGGSGSVGASTAGTNTAGSGKASAASLAGAVGVVGGAGAVAGGANVTSEGVSNALKGKSKRKPRERGAPKK